MPGELNGNKELISLFRKIRGIGSVKLGLVDNWEDAESKTPSLPKIAFFSEAQTYKSMEEEMVQESEMDFCTRILSLEKIHNAYVFTGAIAMAMACNLKGSILYNDLKDKNLKKVVRLGHPSGVMSATLELNEDLNEFLIEGVTLISTSRKIMDGFVYVDE